MTAAGLTRSVESVVERWAMGRERRESEDRDDDDGRPVRSLGTPTDITTRNSTELDLLRRERELQTLADNAPHIIARFDASLRHVFVNAAVERATGRPPADFIGRTNRELGMPAELCDQWEAAIREVFATGSPGRVEFDFPSPDGRRYFEGRLILERFGEGDDPLVLTFTEDVTDRKTVELALRASEARLARAQRAAHVGTWDWNVVTGESHWTDEAWRLFGLPPFSCDVTFEVWVGTVHPDDRAEAIRAVQAGLRGETYHHEFRVLHPDGAVLWLLSEGGVVLGADGRAERFLGTVRDVTLRREADAALRGALHEAHEAVRARDALVSMVSHDLKNPLNTLSLDVTTLQRSAPGDRGRLLARMGRQVKRMTGMIDELLDAAQVHVGQPLSLELSEFDLVPSVRALAEEAQLASPPHRLVVRATSDSIRGRWDPRRIDRLVANLLSNAVKYSPDGGLVRVELEHVSGEDGRRWAVLRVADEGIGVPAGDLERVFEWFGRGANAQRARIAGTGIGLAGARKIAEQHGGSISVESVEDRGSTFTVRLPTGDATGLLGSTPEPPG